MFVVYIVLLNAYTSAFTHWLGEAIKRDDSIQEKQK